MRKYLLVVCASIVTISAVWGQRVVEPYDEGEFWLKLSLPYFSHLRFQPEGEEMVDQFGFLGEAIGVQYTYRHQQFLELGIGLAAVSKQPLPFPIDEEGPYRRPYSVYGSLTNNHAYPAVLFGYGLHYTRNHYVIGFESFDPKEQDLVFQERKINYSAGVILNGYYRIGNSFNVGLMYRPSIVAFREGRTHLQYDHLVSLDLMWRIRLNDRRRGMR